MILGKKEKPPTYEEQVKIQEASDLRTHEAVDNVDYSRIIDSREFALMVLEDGSYLAYFIPLLENGQPNQLYSPAYEPLRLLFSRLLRIGQMTEDEVRKFKRDVHRMAQRAHVLAKTRREHYIIKSMETWIGWTVLGHARHGFFLKTATESRATKRLIIGGEKKKSFFRR